MPASRFLGVFPLVLPKVLLDVVRQHAEAYEVLGLSGKGARWFGITVLFAGPSGTGKTLAAVVLANGHNRDR